MFNFLVAFFLKISEILKAHISGTETDITENVVMATKYLIFWSFSHLVS